jgi:hypothetical protein
MMQMMRATTSPQPMQPRQQNPVTVVGGSGTVSGGQQSSPSAQQIQFGNFQNSQWWYWPWWGWGSPGWWGSWYQPYQYSWGWPYQYSWGGYPYGWGGYSYASPYQWWG